MAQKQKSEIRHWFASFARWVRTLLGIRRKSVSAIKSRRYSTDRKSALFTLERDTPGAVETWRIVHGGATGALLIALDNLPDCRAHYKSERRRASQSGRSYQTTADERGLYLEGGEIHTHRFSFTWLGWSGQKQTVSLLGVFDGDFAGFSKQYAMSLKNRSISVHDEGLKRSLGNRFALKIGEAIAIELLELKPLPGFSWEERVKSYDWGELLTGYTQYVHKSGFDAKIICRSR